MSGYVGAAMFVVATLLLMFWLMRGRVLKEKFTVWWVILAVGVAVFAAIPSLLPWFSSILGIETPSNFVFFIASLMFLLLSVQFSIELSRTDDKTRRLAEELAILRAQIESRVTLSSGTSDAPPGSGTTSSSSHVVDADEGRSDDAG